MLFDKNNNAVFKNKYKGKSIFSLMTGPSFSSDMAAELKNKYTFSIKQIPLSHNLESTLWCCLEHPSTIPWKIWENTNILKIVSDGLWNKGYLKPINVNVPKIVYRGEEINKLQNIYYIKLNESYKSTKYLESDTITWGMSGKKVDEHGFQGRRSIMLAHFKILYWLGFKKIYLCGVDFEMTSAKPYCYDRLKTDQAIQQNNLLYETLKVRLAAIKPLFDSVGLQVFNCNPTSKLEVFPYISFQDALHDDQNMYRN